jgi:pimeloyl-ACP methyl ester carboxylesterase
VFAWFFHEWERRLAAVTTNRVVRDFEWGLDWIEQDGHADPLAALETYSAEALRDSDAFFGTTPAPHYEITADGHLTFESAFRTPHAANNVVHGRFFPGKVRQKGKSRVDRAVVLLPQWNSDAGGHIGLAKLLAHFGMSAVRLSLPYHDWRMPPELERADYIVSSNVARTLQVCRQAVLDAKRAIYWLHQQGYERIGVLGTSLGSCLAMLTAAHEPLVKAAALNHVSPRFADVVWEGLSTQHVRQGLDGMIDFPTLKRLWMPISPEIYLDRLREKHVLLVYARYDLSFPLHLSKELIDRFHACGMQPAVSMLPCGHYSTGMAPFKYLDGYVLTKFLGTKL